MSSDVHDGDETALPPDDAFSALGDETRLAILQALGRAEGPLSFSTLRERVGTRDSSRFNYHLDKLTGHFVEKTGDGYGLRRAGRRVVEAVLSGAVTEDPEMARTPVDVPCHQCGAPTEVDYREEHLAVYCTECPGVYGGRKTAGEDDDRADDNRNRRHEDGFLGYLALPPAGLHGRTAAEAHLTARTWQQSEILPAANGVCPRCAAPLERWADVCEDHDASDGLCPNCGGRHQVLHTAECTNCIYDQRGAALLAVLANTELLAFLTAHGVNPVTGESDRFSETVMAYDEDVRSVDPLVARFTVSVDGDDLSLTVDDSLSVVGVE